MSHPYRFAPDRAFWQRACTGRGDLDLPPPDVPLIRRSDKVISAGSCFAANIVPYLEAAGLTYLRCEQTPRSLAALTTDNFSYSKFSAAYGNIYTVRQAVQLLQRALKRFVPQERFWKIDESLVIDPYRPGLRYPAQSVDEFELLNAQHLRTVLQAFREADVFIFTLGLTEAWMSSLDGAVFPACPGTVAGAFDPTRHVFHNFSQAEVAADLDAFIAILREVNPSLRIVLTVSPVPLVATATKDHVAVATSYSKSVLRVATGEACQRHHGVTYFPSYEIVTGPQAPGDFFESDRRTPSERAIRTVMRSFLARCETKYVIEPDTGSLPSLQIAKMEQPAAERTQPTSTNELSLSQLIVDAECEEAAARR